MALLGSNTILHDIVSLGDLPSNYDNDDCSSFIQAYCVSTVTFFKDGAMSQSADTADANADADEDVDVMLDSLCFSCPSTIVIEQCKLNLIVGVLILKKMRCCVAYLWLTQPFWTNVQMACLDLK